MQNLHSLLYLYLHCKLILQLTGVFSFLQITLLLNKYGHPRCISYCLLETQRFCRPDTTSDLFASVPLVLLLPTTAPLS